jgi:hypothetical protein
MSPAGELLERLAGDQPDPAELAVAVAVGVGLARSTQLRRQPRGRRYQRTGSPACTGRGVPQVTTDQSGSALGADPDWARRRRGLPGGHRGDRKPFAACRGDSASSPGPSPRRSWARGRSGLGRVTQGGLDHLLVPPRPGHPHRAGPLRHGQQRHGPAGDLELFLGGWRWQAARRGVTKGCWPSAPR